eukprot:CAMPEP_0174290828 /NCGR_PEP_ID=MMETSP0809-20121228/30262_1 /TAXON_ID=73025 ORGANISM="Eutreptiella gymnastica-like, Strain CCMP1594" /NCGR_SAMPLE_ID=MMETSP0809 /ASSEMBLY_ACC=CAM_ASM_000658 /LENGTH=355 /DNA_ID=CAMNT_0015389789 /DNA_START=65 /DNA_END=1132 /DNA_ORIENTATION=-
MTFQTQQPHKKKGGQGQVDDFFLVSPQENFGSKVPLKLSKHSQKSITERLYHGNMVAKEEKRRELLAKSMEWDSPRHPALSNQVKKMETERIDQLLDRLCTSPRKAAPPPCRSSCGMHHKTKEEKQFPLVPPPPRFADMSEPLQQDYDPSKDKHLAQFWARQKRKVKQGKGSSMWMTMLLSTKSSAVTEEEPEMAATQEPTPKYTPQVNKRARKKAAAEDKKAQIAVTPIPEDGVDTDIEKDSESEPETAAAEYDSELEQEELKYVDRKAPQENRSDDEEVTKKSSEDCSDQESESDADSTASKSAKSSCSSKSASASSSSSSSDLDDESDASQSGRDDTESSDSDDSDSGSDDE